MSRPCARPNDSCCGANRTRSRPSKFHPPTTLGYLSLSAGPLTSPQVTATSRPRSLSRPALQAVTAFSGEGAGAPPHPGALPLHSALPLSARGRRRRTDSSLGYPARGVPQITLPGLVIPYSVYARAGQVKTGSWTMTGLTSLFDLSFTILLCRLPGDRGPDKHGPGNPRSRDPRQTGRGTRQKGAKALRASPTTASLAGHVTRGGRAGVMFGHTPGPTAVHAGPSQSSYTQHVCRCSDWWPEMRTGRGAPAGGTEQIKSSLIALWGTDPGTAGILAEKPLGAKSCIPARGATARCFAPRWNAPGDWPGPPASMPAGAMNIHSPGGSPH